MPRNGKTFETLIQQSLRMIIEPIMEIVGHAKDKKTVRILLHDLREVVILDAVNELLYDDGCRNLSVVHI